MQLIDQILDITFIKADQLPKSSRDMALLSLFDWMVCGIGGIQEPVSQKIRSYIGSVGSGNNRDCASVFGGDFASPVAAALANGTTAHALDYDDTHFAHIGHLSVGIYPAALASGQDSDASLDQVIDAFLVGAESAIRIGLALGSSHYEDGYHQTATAGAFGAAVAAARLYGLSPQQTRAALSLCSTRASGLKNQFGTMGKPLNAGYAASNGIECARLAMLGMTSADDGLEGSQGFVATHSSKPAPVIKFDRFLFNDIRYKLHACCHGTHAMIEAMLYARNKHSISMEDVRQLRVCVHPKWLKVCDIKLPRTGLEVKFSYAWLAGMVMRGLSCADPEAYTDALADDIALSTFADSVTVVGSDDLADTESRVTFTMCDGKEMTATHDLMGKIEYEVLAGRLNDKASAVIGAKSSALWEQVSLHGNRSSREFHSCMSVT